MYEVFGVIMAVVGAGVILLPAVLVFLVVRRIFRFGKKKPDKKGQVAPTVSVEQQTSPTDLLMTSQFPALYLKDNDPTHRDIYLRKLRNIGFNQENAEKMFEFECDVLRKHSKPYLQDPGFIFGWFFGLRRPFFQQYPQTKEDILKEKFFTMSELCKIIDEAEWHFWNSHERCASDEVFAEIYAWRLQGQGRIFANSYFEMIEKETGIPSENISALCALQGEHLSRYKWR